ncbi:MAG: hypothetical protein ACKN9E_19160 [Microcystaceae cyanobacterium]
MPEKVSDSKIDKIIYLDSEFISSKFEEIKGICPVTQMTKVEGIRGQLSLGLLSSGIHTQETKTFAVSSFQMWLEIESELIKYPDFKVSNFVNYKGTFVGWIKGNLSLGTWKEKESDNNYEYFELYSDNQRVALLTQQEYLAAGFNSILTASSALKSNIGIPTRILARILWYVERSGFYIACPYIILES